MVDLGQELAAALEYTGQGAPRVTAVGGGELARRIRQIAEEHGVPTIEDERLVALLATVPLGEEIPESLFVAVAEVLAYVFAMDAQATYPGSSGQPQSR
jgi:flagellar biosynthesis protein